MTALMLTFLSIGRLQETTMHLETSGGFMATFLSTFSHFQTMWGTLIQAFLDSLNTQILSLENVGCMHGLLSGSMDLAAVAMLHHALCLLQLVAIEKPHMKKVYKRHLKHAKKIR